jgi:diaminopimelate decarboxylase
VLDSLFPEESGIQIIAEPGRYFVTKSHTLAVNVFAKRTVCPHEHGSRDSNNNNSNNNDPHNNPLNYGGICLHGTEKRFQYYINEGVYQSFNCIFFDNATPVPIVLEPRKSTITISNIPSSRNTSSSGRSISSGACCNECSRADDTAVKDNRALYKSTLFGPTCDPIDCIARDVLLCELEVGDWLYFTNMGAYTVASASPFNGFKACPTTYYVQSPLR